MLQSPLKLVVGLGNPGKEYAATRHNIGFMVADKLADAYRITTDKNKFETLFGRGKIDGRDVIIAKPQAFMNRSGPPVYRLSNFYRISCEDMLIVHDDIDLAFGRIKIKEKGGDGGHKGIRSIKDAFGEGDFIRLRIGIGRSGAGADVVNHVLGRFSSEETGILGKIIDTAMDATVTVLCKGAKEGMNRFNRMKTIN
ncbi:MAG: aminoacyl-tRNA hydrolase [Desulfobacterales bacterium]